MQQHLSERDDGELEEGELDDDDDPDVTPAADDGGDNNDGGDDEDDAGEVNDDIDDNDEKANDRLGEQNLHMIFRFLCLEFIQCLKNPRKCLN